MDKRLDDAIDLAVSLVCARGGGAKPSAKRIRPHKERAKLLRKLAPILLRGLMCPGLDAQEGSEPRMLCNGIYDEMDYVYSFAFEHGDRRVGVIGSETLLLQ